MDIGERLFRWSERIRAIGQTGLAYDPHPYDAERYHEMIEVGAEIQAAAMEEDPHEIGDAWRAGIGRRHSGYVTPQTSVIAVVRDAEDRLLLLQRPDSGGWFPPAGWADVGRSAQAVAVKEVAEETGYFVRPTRFLGCYDSHMRAFSPLHFYCLFWDCELVGGELRRNELEALDIGWFSQDRLPKPLHGGDWWVELAFGGGERACFDLLPDEELRSYWK